MTNNLIEENAELRKTIRSLNDMIDHLNGEIDFLREENKILFRKLGITPKPEMGKVVKMRVFINSKHD